MAVERHHDRGKCYKEKYLIEMVPYSFRGLDNYHHGGEHGGWEYSSVQTDIVLENSTS